MNFGPDFRSGGRRDSCVCRSKDEMEDTKHVESQPRDQVLHIIDSAMTQRFSGITSSGNMNTRVL